MIPLAPHTTLGVGGPARLLARPRDDHELVAALDAAHGLPVLVLGGGSNLLISDAGFDGLVVQLPGDAPRVDPHSGRVEAPAGLLWDELVAASVEAGLGGLESTSGVPGTVGGAAVQNLGAYGQELADVLVSVDAVHLHSLERHRFTADACGLSYRHSRFKGGGDWLITSVELQLQPGAAPSRRHGQLAAWLGPNASLADARRAVLQLRRGKSMTLDVPDDPNRRSAGSFFVNPVVEASRVASIQRAFAEELPGYPQPDGRIKLSAAWLIQHSGFPPGWGEGRAGLSSRHCLAVVNRGAARAADVVDVARAVQRGVHERCGVRLVPEVVLVGFTRNPLEWT